MTTGRPNTSGSDPKSDATLPTSSAVVLGQVFTPPDLARAMAMDLLAQRPQTPVRILDPAVGPWTFPRAMGELGVLTAEDQLLARDVDASMIDACLAESLRPQWDVAQGDYVEEDHSASFDYAILNPPWVRQEWIAKKSAYRELLLSRYGEHVPGTSNLYVYFLVRVVHDLKPGGKFAAIVYDSWKSTRYGQWLRDFLERHCDYVRWTPAGPQPFEGRLVDATVLVGQRAPKGRQSRPLQDDGAAPALGFAPLNDLADTKRGLRLKQASFFLAKEPVPGATPFVKKVGRVRGYSLPPDHHEWALLVHHPGEDSPVLLEIRKRLTQAVDDPDNNKPVLNWHRERPETWFVHRRPPRAPILFNYYLRNAPRHILSDGRAYSDNFYGVTPRPGCPVPAAFAVLNSRRVGSSLVEAARSQGNGLVKLQLFEYRDVLIPDWRMFAAPVMVELTTLGNELAASDEPPHAVVERIDDAIDRALRQIEDQGVHSQHSEKTGTAAVSPA